LCVLVSEMNVNVCSVKAEFLAAFGAPGHFVLDALLKTLAEALAHSRNKALGFLFFGHLLFVNGEVVEPAGWHDELYDDSPNERECTDASADLVLSPGQARAAGHHTTSLADEDLHGEDDEENQQEAEVVEERVEDVELAIAELTRIDHVEDLAHHE